MLAVTPGDGWTVVRFSLDREHAPLVARKGSIAVDGVSLTVSAVGDDWFEVSLIPETLAATTLGALRRGDRVNIETDILARHVLRMNEFSTEGAPSMSLSDIPAALEALRAGRPIIVADDEGRENEGDVIIAAESRQPGDGRLDGARHLRLPLRADDERDRRPARAAAHGGRRARTRAAPRTRSASMRRTASAPASAPATGPTPCACSPTPTSTPTSLIRPGHILPLRAVDGGVRERDGHTEAAVDLMKLAGLTPVAAIGEIVDEDGEMMRLPGLIALGEREDVPVITIEALIRFMEERTCETDPTAQIEVPELPARDLRGRDERADRARRRSACAPTATARPAPTTSPGSSRASPRDGALVRVHSECLTGEAFGSQKCECGPQLEVGARHRSSARAASSSTCAGTRAAASA